MSDYELDPFCIVFHIKPLPSLPSRASFQVYNNNNTEMHIRNVPNLRSVALISSDLNESRFHFALILSDYLYLTRCQDQENESYQQKLHVQKRGQKFLCLTTDECSQCVIFSRIDAKICRHCCPLEFLVWVLINDN